MPLVLHVEDKAWCLQDPPSPLPQYLWQHEGVVSPPLYTIHYTLYTVYYLLHYTLYTIYQVLCLLLYTLYTVYYLQYTIHCILFTRCCVSSSPPASWQLTGREQAPYSAMDRSHSLVWNKGINIILNDPNGQLLPIASSSYGDPWPLGKKLLFPQWPYWHCTSNSNKQKILV